MTSDEAYDTYSEVLSQFFFCFTRLSFLGKNGSPHPLAAAISLEDAEAVVKLVDVTLKEPPQGEANVRIQGSKTLCFEVIHEVLKLAVRTSVKVGGDGGGGTSGGSSFDRDDSGSGSDSDVQMESAAAPSGASSSDRPSPFTDFGAIRTFAFLLALHVPKFGELSRTASPSSGIDEKERQEALRILRVSKPRLRQAYDVTSDFAKLLWWMRAHVLVNVLDDIVKYEKSGKYKKDTAPAQQDEYDKILKRNLCFLESKMGPTNPHSQVVEFLRIARNVAKTHPRPTHMSMLTPESAAYDGSLGVSVDDEGLTLTINETSRAVHRALDRFWTLLLRIFQGLDYSEVAKEDKEAGKWVFGVLKNEKRTDVDPGTSFASLNGLTGNLKESVLRKHLVSESLRKAALPTAPEDADAQREQDKKDGIRPLDPIFVRIPSDNPEDPNELNAEPNHLAIKGYLEVFQEMRNILFWLSQVVPGGPRRVREAIRTRYANSRWTSAERNIFVLLDEASEVGTSFESQGGSHKSRNGGVNWGDRDMIRLFGQELTAVFLLFFVYILPFEYYLRKENGATDDDLIDMSELG